jgi:hypothetical protein
MSRARRAAALAAALGLAALAAGCANTPSRAQAPNPPPAAPLSVTTSVTASGVTWASVPMGAPSGANQFWQLFRQPVPGGQWSLDTPPDIATNGAIVLGGQDGAELTAGVRPSLDLAFSPVTTTGDGGRTWATLPPESGLANVPDSLAVAPDSRLMALGQDDTAAVLAPAGGAWSGLTTKPALAATSAGRACAVTGLTAVAFTPYGTPLLGGTCGRAGVAGIFAQSGGTWHLAGPALPASLTGQHVQVLRLRRTGTGNVALLEAGTGQLSRLLAAWTRDGGTQWSLSPALPLGGSSAVSASFGSSGSVGVVLSGGRGEILAGPGGSWQALPALPAGRTVTLALPAAGTTEALAADGSLLTAWQVSGGAGRWSKVQTIKVPIQYGSSS